MKRYLTLLTIIVVFVVSCSPSLKPAATLSPPTSTLNSPTQTLPAISTETIEPTQTINPFPNPVLKITGVEEIVFDWTSDRCENHNIPDLPARAFRGADGQVQLIISDNYNYRMVGPDLNTLAVDCNPIMLSDNDADPSLFNDNEWIASPYTLDGMTIYALTHNEYQGHIHPGKCPQNDYFSCWDNSITLSISTDSGRTYSDAFQPPSHLVARLPFVYEAGAGPDGYRGPSNIIKGKDDFYYSFFNVSMYRTQRQWVCLMRTDDLSDPASWRYWDGREFEGLFINPYIDPPINPVGQVCTALASDEIGASMNESITYNTYLDRYVLVGIKRGLA